MMQNNNTYSKKAYGKINLYLDVLDKREDGYHNIRSVMQTVSLCDTVTLTVADSDKTDIEIFCSDARIKCDKTNLVYKAAALFLESVSSAPKKYSFTVEKNIPVSAGMAGGSADAAATLQLLNEAFEYPYSTDELCVIGSKIGADVPFCIRGGTCICEGIGKRLTSLPTLSGITVISAIDASSVSTPRAFSMLDARYGTDCTDSSDIDKMVEAISRKDLSGVCSSLYNKFENVIIDEHQGITKIKDILTSCGAKGVLMSGSGPSVFGIFDDDVLAENALGKLHANKINANMCITI